MAGEYDELLSLIRPGDTVLDCGGNIGCFSVLAGNRAGPGGRVISVEPEPENLALLRLNAELNGLANIEIVPRAIYSRTGVQLGIESGGVSAHVTHGVDRPVDSISLADLLTATGSRRFDIIKMDIEGAEIDALRSPGSDQVLSACRGISAEVHSLEAERLLVDCLRRIGFDTSGPRGESEHLLRLVRRVAGRPILTTTLYRRELIRVCRRLLSRPSRPSADQLGYRPGIVSGVKGD
jgi:FkbM family methyltransferase